MTAYNYYKMNIQYSSEAKKLFIYIQFPTHTHSYFKTWNNDY